MVLVYENLICIISKIIYKILTGGPRSPGKPGKPSFPLIPGAPGGPTNPLNPSAPVLCKLDY